MMSLAICPLHVLIFAFHFLRCENFFFFAKDFAVLRKKLSRSVNVLLTKRWISSYKQGYRQQKSSLSVNLLFSKHWVSTQKDKDKGQMNSCAKSFEMCLTRLWNGMYFCSKSLEPEVYFEIISVYILCLVSEKWKFLILDPFTRF